MTPADRLAAGAHVRVVAPSGPVDRERLERGGQVLRELGFEVTLGRHVLDAGDPPYLAGTDRDRARDLEDAWCDPAVGAVWAARGGYGAARTVAALDWARLRAARAAKPLVGSSDATALLFAFARRLGVAGCFGPMVAGPVLGDVRPDPATLDGLRACLLTDGPFELRVRRAPVPGTARGPILVGTLAMICSLLGTPDLPPARGAIVLLEDVGEAPYRIDRMLTQLRAAGWLSGVAGVGCGSWEGCGPAGDVESVLRDRLGDLGVPVVTGLPFGHGPTQATLPLGADAVLDADRALLRVRP